MSNRALLVGINDYKGISDLRGCLNDVTNVRNILKQYYGFTNNDIRVLVDSRATEENIISRMEWLITDVKADDKIFFHFSGHGSQILDRDGDELRDRKDEILCCWDMSWDNGYIIDDYLDEWLKRIPRDVCVEVILDACHSGTGYSINPTQRARVTGIGDQRDPAYDVINRFLEPPLDIEMRSEGDDLESNRFINAITDQSWKQQSSTENFSATMPHHIVWSGCGEAQTSADAFINGNFNGAFTYYWCKTLRKNNGEISRRNLLRDMCNSLRHNGYTQVPELTCEELFSSKKVLG